MTVPRRELKYVALVELTNASFLFIMKGYQFVGCYCNC